MVGQLDSYFWIDFKIRNIEKNMSIQLEEEVVTVNGDRFLQGVEEDDGDLLEEEWNDWEGTKSRPERWAPLGANDADGERYPAKSPTPFL